MSARVFRIALAFAALSVLDDAFWHPEPGTSAGDHVVAALIPVTIAALLAAAYPRLRPGARIVAAFTAGVLMVVAGVTDGVRHDAIDRLAGDDVTAIAAAVAGVVLIVLGVVDVWRTRRMDERPVRRYARRGLVAVVAVAATLFVIVPVALAIIANHAARAPVPAADLGRPHLAWH